MMPKRTYAITGATGQIGHALAEELLRRGHTVRALGRNADKLAALKAKGAEAHSAALDDADSLAAVFAGAHGVFTMIPPGYTEDDFGAYQDRVGQAVAAAIRQAAVAHVVNLSSLGAQHPDGTGPIKGLHRQEQRLQQIPGLNVVHLRPGYFMENQLWSIATIKQQGINGSPIRGDLPILMVAARDIAAKATELLDGLSFRGQSVLELVGPKPVTLNEATAILGKAIGKPGLQYAQFPYDQARQAMLGLGMKPSIADLMIEMYEGFHSGRVAPQGQPVKGKTSFEEFARLFAEAFRGEPVAA
ncbi:MAG: NAD(P)H-binding protein [Candidatus Omnitrophica bacterium]|nr:NAD(P)H-binding protein [Candidatus Omnitrophota bacterium]